MPLEVAQVVQPTAYAQKAQEEAYNPYTSCIVTARLLGANLPPGDAKNLLPNAQMLDVDTQAVLLRYGDVYHVAVIFFIDNDGLHVGEGNYVADEYTERVIDFDDPAIVGYWKE